MAPQEEQGTSSPLRRYCRCSTSTTSTTSTGGRRNKESIGSSSSLLSSIAILSPPENDFEDDDDDDGTTAPTKKRHRRDASSTVGVATAAAGVIANVAEEAATAVTFDSPSSVDAASKDELIEKLKAKLGKVEGERAKGIERSKLLEANNTSLTKAIEAVTSALAMSGNQSASSNENEAKLKTLEQEKEELVEKLAKAQSKELASSKAAHMNAKVQFESDLSAAKNTIRRLQVDKDNLKASAAALLTKLQRCDRKFLRAIDRIAEQDEDLVKAKDSNRELREENAKLKDQYSKVVEDMNTAKAKLKADQAVRRSYLLTLDHMETLSAQIKELDNRNPRSVNEGISLIPRQDIMTIRFKDNQVPFNKDVVLRVKKSRKMSKLFDEYAVRQDMNVSDVIYLRFLLCGERICPDDTPEILEMKSNDIIDVVYEQPFPTVRFLSCSNHALRAYSIQNLRESLNDLSYLSVTGN